MRLTSWLAIALTTACNGYSTGFQHQAEARIVASVEDLVGGPAAQGRPGDLLLRNRYVHAIVQQPGLPASSLGQHGGNLIDLDVARRPYAQGDDRLNELVFWYQLGRGPLNAVARIADDGALTGRAAIDVVAADVRLGAVDLKTIAAALNPDDPAALFADIDPDQEIALDIRTRYSLGPDDRSLLIETFLLNRGESALALAVGDLIDVRDDAEPFFAAAAGILFGQPSQGFGKPLPIGEIGYNQIEYVGWQAESVAYAYYPDRLEAMPFLGKTSCLRAEFGLACLFGARINALSGVIAETNAWPEQDEGLLTIPPRGEGFAVFRRRVAVGDPDLSQTLAAMAVARGETVHEAVIAVADADGQAMADADVALLVQDGDGFWRPRARARTGIDGLATLLLPPGNYRALVQKSGWTNAATGGPQAPASVDFELPADTRPELQVTLGRSGAVDFFTRDDRSQPQPARVLVLGTDLAPEKLYLGDDGEPTLDSAAGQAIFPFGDSTSDPLPDLSTDAYALPASTADGDAITTNTVLAVLETNTAGLARLTLEPGSYVAVASRGPAFAPDARRFDVVAGNIVRVLLEPARVVDTLGWAAVDFAGEARGQVETLAAAAAAEGLDFWMLSERNVVPALPGSGAGVALDAGSTLVLPGIGEFAMTPMTALPSPIRHKPVTDAGETLSPASLDGGATPWLEPRSGELTAPADLLTTLAARDDAGDTPLLMLRHPVTYLERIGLTFDFTAGYAPDAPEASAPQPTAEAASLRVAKGALYSDAWHALLLDARSSKDLTQAWKAVNLAFGFWNLGRKTPLLAGSGDGRRMQPGPGGLRTLVRHPSESDVVFSAATESGAELARTAAREGRAIVTNAPKVELTVSAALFDTQPVTPTVIDVFERVGIGELLLIARDHFPSAGLDFELRVTADVVVQTPLWAPVHRIELFVNAPMQDVDGVDDDPSGAFLTAAAVTSWTLSDATLAAAVTAGSYFAADTDGTIVAFASDSQRYEIRRSYTWTVAGVGLLSGQLSDQWVAARVLGQSALAPFVNGGDGVTVPAWAVANPVFVDLGGDEGVDFPTAFEGPCELADDDVNCPQ